MDNENITISDLFPKEWLTDRDFRISKNVMRIEGKGKRTLFKSTRNLDVRKSMETILRNNQHPFDEITYFIKLPNDSYETIVDVRNNLQNQDYCAVARIVENGEHIGNIAYGREKSTIWFARDERDTLLMKQKAKWVNRLNLQVAHYVLAHCSQTAQKKVNGNQSKKYHRVENNKSRSVIRIEDISTLRLSTFVEGNGTKHSCEYDVRGHYRHYKNGKVSFVKPYTCCKGKGVKIQHEYYLQSDKH